MVRPIEQSTQPPIEQLQTFFLGQRKKEVPTGGSKRGFESVPIWIFNEESVAAMLHLSPGGFHNTRYEWVIYKGDILLAARPGAGRSAMNLSQHQWEELFRLGFRFSLHTADGKVYKKEFTEIDLPENLQKKLVAQYPGLANVLWKPPRRLMPCLKDLTVCCRFLRITGVQESIWKQRTTNISCRGGRERTMNYWLDI